MFSFLSGKWLEGFPECPWTGQKALKRVNYLSGEN
jgi:hypothetical protein